MKTELKRINDSLDLYVSENLIENYSLTSEITFSKLIGFLLTLNFSTKIELLHFNSANETEKRLVGLLNKIFENYNQGVDTLKTFIQSLHASSQS